MKALKIFMALFVMVLMVGSVFGSIQKPAGFIGSLREDPDGNKWRYEGEGKVTLVVLSTKGLISNPLLNRQANYYYYSDEEVARAKCKSQQTSLWVDPDATTGKWFCVPSPTDSATYCSGLGYTNKDTDCGSTSCDIPRSCTDSDSGNQYVMGTTTGFSTQTCKDEEYIDYCKDDYTLVEYMCVLNEPYEYTITSSTETCENGRFVETSIGCEEGRTNEKCTFGAVAPSGEKVWQYSYTDTKFDCTKISPIYQCKVGELCDVSKGGCYVSGTPCNIGKKTSIQCTKRTSDSYVYSYYEVQSDCTNKLIKKYCEAGQNCDYTKGCTSEKPTEETCKIKLTQTIKLSWPESILGGLWESLKGIVRLVTKTGADWLITDTCQETRTAKSYESINKEDVVLSLCDRKENCILPSGKDYDDVSCDRISSIEVDTSWMENENIDRDKLKVCVIKESTPSSIMDGCNPDTGENCPKKPSLTYSQLKEGITDADKISSICYSKSECMDESCIPLATLKEKKYIPETGGFIKSAQSTLKYAGLGAAGGAIICGGSIAITVLKDFSSFGWGLLSTPADIAAITVLCAKGGAIAGGVGGYFGSKLSDSIQKADDTKVGLCMENSAFSFQKILDWVKTTFGVSSDGVAWGVLGGLILFGIIALMLLVGIVSPKR